MLANECEQAQQAIAALGQREAGRVMSNSIARKLDSIQQKRAMRSVEVANVVGARPETVSRWNQGKAFPRPDAQKLLLELEYIVDRLSDFYEPQDARLERDISIGEAGDVFIGDLQKRVR